MVWGLSVSECSPFFRAHSRSSCVLTAGRHVSVFSNSLRPCIFVRPISVIEDTSTWVSFQRALGLTSARSSATKVRPSDSGWGPGISFAQSVRGYLFSLRLSLLVHGRSVSRNFCLVGCFSGGVRGVFTLACVPVFITVNTDVNENMHFRRYDANNGVM